MQTLFLALLGGILPYIAKIAVKPRDFCI